VPFLGLIRKKERRFYQMPLFGKRDEAENRFKEAKRYSDPSKKEFDLESAISLLEEALMLKADNEQYRQKLDEIREIKAKKFVMQITAAMNVTLEKEVPGVVIIGRVYLGTIQNGDEVQIRGPRGTIRAKVFDVVNPKSLGVPGKELRLAIQGVANYEDVSKGILEKV